MVTHDWNSVSSIAYCTGALGEVKQGMRQLVYEIVGILLVICSVFFFIISANFLAKAAYIASILNVFVGFALIRAGLELTKIGLLAAQDE